MNSLNENQDLKRNILTILSSKEIKEKFNTENINLENFFEKIKKDKTLSKAYLEFMEAKLNKENGEEEIQQCVLATSKTIELVLDYIKVDKELYMEKQTSRVNSDNWTRETSHSSKTYLLNPEGDACEILEGPLKGQEEFAFYWVSGKGLLTSCLWLSKTGNAVFSATKSNADGYSFCRVKNLNFLKP